MNNKEKGRFLYEESVISAMRENHDQFKPQPLPDNPYPENVFPPLNDDDLCAVKEVLKHELNMPIDRLSAHIGRMIFNLCYSTYVTPLQNHIEGLNDGYAQCDEKIKEMSETIESLQKELVVEKERLEKEKRQLLIGLHFYMNDDSVGYESISKELKITPDEVRVSIAKADLMIKEFIKY